MCVVLVCDILHEPTANPLKHAQVLAVPAFGWISRVRQACTSPRWPGLRLAWAMQLSNAWEGRRRLVTGSPGRLDSTNNAHRACHPSQPESTRESRVAVGESKGKKNNSHRSCRSPFSPSINLYQQRPSSFPAQLLLFIIDLSFSVKADCSFLSLSLDIITTPATSF